MIDINPNEEWNHVKRDPIAYIIISLQFAVALFAALYIFIFQNPIINNESLILVIGFVIIIIFAGSTFIFYIRNDLQTKHALIRSFPLSETIRRSYNTSQLLNTFENKLGSQIPPIRSSKFGHINSLIEVQKDIQIKCTLDLDLTKAIILISEPNEVYQRKLEKFFLESLKNGPSIVDENTIRHGLESI